MLDVYLILQGESEDENKIFIPHHFGSQKRSDQKISSLHHSDPDVLSRHLFIVEQKDDSLSCEIFYGEEISHRTFFSQQQTMMCFFSAIAFPMSLPEARDKPLEFKQLQYNLPSHFKWKENQV